VVFGNDIMTFRMSIVTCPDRTCRSEGLRDTRRDARKNDVLSCEESLKRSARLAALRRSGVTYSAKENIGVTLLPLACKQ